MSLFGAKFPELLHPGDARWAYPTTADIAKANLEQVKSIIGPALTNNALEITIVGDISVDQAIKSVGATIGALPTRMGAKPQAPQPGDLKFPAPTPQPVVLYHSGRADQGTAAIAWKTTDVYADDESAARGMLKDILQLRMLDELRIRDGATYSPGATASASRTFPGYGYIAAFAEIPPDKEKLFFDTVQKIAADLRDKGPTPEDLERARKPAIDSLEKAIETNNFWLSSLAGSQGDERRLKLVREAMPKLEAVTAADVQRVARKYLLDDRAWKLVIEPKPKN
jgi:zinc protease